MVAMALAGTVLPVKHHNPFTALSHNFAQAEMNCEEKSASVYLFIHTCYREHKLLDSDHMKRILKCGALNLYS